MSGATDDRFVHLDALDQQIIHCLQLAHRAPFAVIADVLGVSEQTVARRFRRMRTERLVRVIGLVNPIGLGQTGWGVRLRCRPSATREIARALARRDDVGWVSIAAGGAEVLCVLRSRSVADRDELMLEQLPRTAQVQDIEASAVLHIFRGSTTQDWRLGESFLPDSALEQLAATGVALDGHAETLRPDDEALVRALAEDGRASYAALATATGWTEGRAARRLHQLLASGVVYLDIDLAMHTLGFTTSAQVALGVEPAHLAAAGEALAANPKVVFAGATTGRLNLTVSVVCRSAEELYAFVSDDLGSLSGVRAVETTLIASTLKQAGSMLENGRLAPPASRR